GGGAGATGWRPPRCRAARGRPVPRAQTPLAAMACQNTELIVLPTDVTAATATSAMSAHSRAYSSRSCPSERRISRPMAIRTRFMAPSSESAGRDARPPPRALLPRLRERRRDVREARVPALARRGHGRDGDERDQRDEQGVLEQVLRVVGPHELAQPSDEMHVPSLLKNVHAERTGGRVTPPS